MNTMKQILIAMIAYISTDIDDFFIDLVLYSAAESKKDEMNIIIGKYVGMFLLILVSLLGATGLQYFFESYTKYLGFIPIILGTKQGIQNFKGDKEDVTINAISVFSVTGITLASGADNIGVYIPLFSSMSWNEKMNVILVFIVMTWIFCYLAKKIVHRPMIQDKLTKYKKIIVPAVYILLGLYILAK